MIGVLKKIWDFAGEEQDNIRKSMILGFFYAVFHMFQIAAIYVVVLALVGGSTGSAPAWQALGLLLASILGRAVLNRFSQLQQTHAGYFMVANKRISIGDKLKRVPMGYFNDQSLGELTGITTTVLDEVESTGPMVLVGILGGLINSAVMLLCVLFWDWRIGLLALAGMLVYLALLSGMEKQSAKIAPKRQRDEARLVEAVLEQLQGMSVIKSFNLTGKGDKRVRQALEDSRANNLAVEKLFTPYIWGQEMVLHLFSVLILAASVGLCLTEAMSLANALMAVIVSFLIFSQIQSAGSGVSALRLVGSSIDHANQVDDIPEMDQRGTVIRPEDHEIVFDHVNFSYGSRPILKDVSLTIPDRTTTAIVGPSGSGKTTTAMKVERELERRGVNAHTVSMDNYFKTLNRRTAPRTPEGDIDYESPKLLDMELLDETFDRLSRGEEVIVPHFEFARQMRNDSRGTPLRLGKDEIAIFEGIHALNDDIAGRHPEATGMYISARSNILEGEQLRFKGTWMRISRRAVRDYNFRGTDLLETLLMWYNVRRGEKKYISPYKGRAHVIIDSSLRYEVPVFAHYADALRAAVEQVPPDNERWQEYHDLVDAFRYFEPVDPALVAPDSLLREFIGGGRYHY